jgi:hypothetical protein
MIVEWCVAVEDATPVQALVKTVMRALQGRT